MRFVRAALATAVAAAVIAVPSVGSAHAPTAGKPKKFANCTAMHRVYPHGVGKQGARDKTSGTPVTTFKRNNALYAANSGSDRDGDKIACEAA